MRSENLKEAKKLVYAAAIAAAVAGASLTAYAASTASTTASTSAATSGATDSSTDADGRKGHRPPEDDGSIMAKIGDIDDETLTLYTAEKPERPAGESETAAKPADGETPPEKPADGEEPPEKPADGEEPPEKPADGEEPPEKPADDASSENGTDEKGRGRNEKRPEMTFSDTATEATVTDDTTITKGKDHTSVSLSSLSEGAVVRVVLDGSRIVSIDLMEEPAE